MIENPEIGGIAFVVKFNKDDPEQSKIIKGTIYGLKDGFIFLNEFQKEKFYELDVFNSKEKAIQDLFNQTEFFISYHEGQLYSFKQLKKKILDKKF